jgi:acetolactate synthase small subunit
MADRVVRVEATSSDEVPARITGLLAQRRMQVSSLHMARRLGDGAWSIQLTVTVADDNQAKLLVKRLNRLVDVVRVVDPDAGAPPLPENRSTSSFWTREPATPPGGNR